MTPEFKAMVCERGVSLEALGLTELALRRGDALRAIDLLRDALVPVLGGDVYHRRLGEIAPAYANWYANPGVGETTADFAARSAQLAIRYVEDYPAYKECEVLIVLVPQRPQCALEATSLSSWLP